MNFFERQAQARRHSSRLVLLFALAVLGIVLAVDAATYLVFGGSRAVLAFTTLVTLAIIGLGSVYRVATLRAGGEPVAYRPLNGDCLVALQIDTTAGKVQQIGVTDAYSIGSAMERVWFSVFTVRRI